MTDQIDFMDRLTAVAAARGLYRPDAYLFVWEALERTATLVGEKRHVSGDELLAGIRDLARTRFGPMAKDVFNAWGVTTTGDFGRVVFDLVEGGLLRKTEEDSLEDFADRFDFQREFVDEYFRGRV